MSINDHFASHRFSSINDSSSRKRRHTLVFIGDFPQKSPMISGSFAERDLQVINDTF